MRLVESYCEWRDDKPGERVHMMNDPQRAAALCDRLEASFSPLSQDVELCRRTLALMLEARGRSEPLLLGKGRLALLQPSPRLLDRPLRLTTRAHAGRTSSRRRAHRWCCREHETEGKARSLATRGHLAPWFLVSPPA